MFRRAVEAHKPEDAAAQKTLQQQLFSSSNPAPESTLQALALGRTSSREPLRPSPSSLLNANGLSKMPNGANTAVKRTAMGLAKVASMQDDFGFDDTIACSKVEDNRPRNRTSHSKKSRAGQEDVFFDEDDFDSDIDLDVEKPALRPQVPYPTLPRAVSPKPITYPSVQKAHLHQTATTQLEYSSHSVLPSESMPLPPSSVPLPWSSSPEYHRRTPPRENIFGGFAYTHQNISKVQTLESNPQSEAYSANGVASRPTKRRTLPWLEAQTTDDYSEPAATSTARTTYIPKAPISHEFTPASKASTASPYPWNTTASAVKEQQKLLRKSNNDKKHLVRAVQATDEAKTAAIKAKKSKNIARPHLSAEQRHVLDLVVENGKSVFFTGSAGTGKSVLLREIISVLRKKYSRESDRIAITASTGLAACNIGGVTLHSFAGIGLGKEGVDELVKKIKRNQKAKHRWMRTKVLVVDEISMVDGELFDKLEEIARRLRNNGRPFGGIQLVITGDFFQLPPVPEHGSSRNSQFCFDAKSWSSSIEHTIGLHHVFRQKDPVFAGMLNEMRMGYLSPASVAAFKRLNRDLPAVEGLTATELFPTRAEVDAANIRRMSQLLGETMIFEARDGGTIVDKTARDKLLGNCMAPPLLELKKGSQVMLIKNMDETLVNGSVGKVLGFMDEATWNSYNPEGVSRSQESDDDTLEHAITKPKARLDAMLANTSQRWPVVRFTQVDGTTRDLLCQREPWKVELPNGEVQASRNQVPLILAWALSIHKAQGQTLERVKVDLGKVFEKGQAYVALSRATSMAGLQVLRFDPSKVLAHERVRTFYNGLSRAEELEKSQS